MIAVKKSAVAEIKVFSMTDIQDTILFLSDISRGVIVADDCVYFVFKSDDNTVLCEVLDGVVIENCLCVNHNDVIIRTGDKVSVMSQQDFDEHYVTIARGAEKNEHWN